MFLNAESQLIEEQTKDKHVESLKGKAVSVRQPQAGVAPSSREMRDTGAGSNREGGMDRLSGA